MIIIIIAQDDLRGETYGPNSGCFDHASRWTRSGVMSNPFGSGCYEVSINCLMHATILFFQLHC